MTRMISRILSLALALVITIGMFCAVPVTVSADSTEDPPYFDHGECGSPDSANAQWYMFKDGTVVIFGTGAIASYEPANVSAPASPWYTSPYLMASLTSTKIAIEDGITAIGDYDFFLPTMYAMAALQTVNVDLPDSLTTIGAHAFENQIKLQKLTIPYNVTTIGTDAFAGCSGLRDVDFYCDPTTLDWADDSNPFTQTVTCHVKSAYREHIDELNRKYKAKNVVFEANLYEGLVDDGIERNIRAYMGQETTSIFGGSVPTIVIGTFSGQKKSVTHGSNGFATCVRLGTEGNYEYYVSENNSINNLFKANLSSSGFVSGLGEQHSSLELVIDFEYVGTNIVKVIYRLRNNGASDISNVMLGGAGDIKIGADDYAAIHPLTEGTEQVGFYMTSRNTYDKADDDTYATLGFIGKGVEIRKDTTVDPPASVMSKDATFFYGSVAGNSVNSNTGVYRHRFFPDKVFTVGGDAQISGDYNTNNTKDSGMSYFWNVGTLEKNSTQEFAVLFSVYGNDTTKTDGGQSMIAEKSKTYHTVTWENHDSTVLLKQVVEENAAPVYDGDLPVKPSDENHHYEFSGWSSDGGTTVLNNGEFPNVTGNITYTAQFAEKARFFAKHSLTLDQGDIGVNFYIDPAGADLTADQIASGAKKIKIKFNWFDKKSEFTVDPADLKTKVIDGRTYYATTCRVAAAEMAYNIHAVAFINGTEFTKEYDDYSVMKYGNTIISAPDGTFPDQAKLVRLTRTMLDYGAKAQVVFDRHKDIDGRTVPLANDFSDYACDFGYSMEPHDIGGTAPDLTAPEDSGLEYYAVSMVFLSTTTIRHYYRVVDKAKFDALSNRDSFKKNGTLYYLETESIRANKLNDPYTFYVGASEYTYSALDYVRKLQSRTEAEQALGTAVYWYSDAADAYFPY